MKNTRFVWVVAVTALVVTSFVTAQITGNPWKPAGALPAVKGKEAVMVQVQPDGNRALTMRYRIPGLFLTETVVDPADGKRTRLVLGNAPLRGNQGEPVLPVVPVQFVIPIGKEIDEITVQDEKRTSLPLTYAVEYGSAPVPLMPNATVKKAVPDAAIYSSDNAYPAKNYELVCVQKKRGVEIGIVNLHPVTYFPKTNRVDYSREFEIKVTFKSSARAGNKALRLRSTQFDLKKLGVENPDAIEEYRTGTSKTVPATPPEHMLLDPAESFQYVVITSEAIRDAATDVTINDLLSYRQSLGLTATLVTIESIFADYTGVDNAEKVRNFIIDAYTNWETEYVVLGGDVGIIPIRDLYTDGDVIHSDLYYQCLDGTFNGDGDGYWGEPNDGEDGGDVDLFAEVNVGRISAETPEEMSNAVFKILAYERDNEAQEYLRTGCMVGEELGSQFGPGEFGFAHPYMNEIKNGSSASGYTTIGFNACPAITVDSLDDFDAEWPVDSLINRINAGKYSIINHLGHANTDYVMKMSNGQADSLTNDKFIFTFSQGCFPGDMTGDCIAEHLTTSSRHGFYAGVFNSHYGWGAYNESYENLDAPSQRINRQFWDAYFAEYIYNLGAINADSHEDNVWNIDGELIRWCIYETNLFGDPYTVIRGQTQGPNVVLKAATIDDNNGGNGDRIINPGEQIALTLSLRNIGNGVATGVSASLTISDPYISIGSGNLSFGDMPCCGVITNSSNTGTISVAADCPTPYAFPITVEITDNSGNSWVQTFTLNVHTSYTISGRVLTLTGSNPVAGAVIKVTGPVSGEAATNAAGEYLFTGIEGTYTLYAEAPGYLKSEAASVTLPPNAANLDFVIGRPQMTVDPVAITHLLQVNDSITIPLQITNNGDMDLLVTPKSRGISVALIKGTPKIIPGSGEKSKVERYSDFAKTSTFTKLTPSKRTIAKTAPLAGKQRILYLNTIIYGDEPDMFVKGMLGLENVESVDMFNAESSTPDLNYLLQYDIVVLASSYPWADAELVGNMLADYVDAGGSVCLLVASIANSGGYGLEGRITTDEYLPIEMGDAGKSSKATTFEPHQITGNMTSLECEIPVNTASIRGEGVSLGTYNTGYLVGAYHKTKPIVAINVFPEDGYWGGDLILMMSNTFDWFGQRLWLSISPDNHQLTIASGATAEIAVKLKSVNLFGGLYTGEIKLAHNDPQQTNPIIVPVELTIDGFKSLTVTPAALSFGNLWLGLKDTLPLTLSNTGTQKTIVNAITVNNPLYTAAASLPLSILAGRSLVVGVIYTPDALGPSSATITVASDAEDNPSIMIDASAVCTPGPEARLAPTAMTFDLGPKDAPADQTAVLSNVGGDVLSYRTYIRQKSKPAFDLAPVASLKKNRDMKRFIYSPYNYRHEFALDRVIVAFIEGKTNLANPSLLMKLGDGKVRELATARIPKKGIKAYNGKKLIVIPLANNSRDGVLDAVKLLRQDINVAYVEPDYRVKAIGVPNDPMFPEQYALNNSGQTGGTADADIDAVEGWDIFTGEGSEVILGIIDTGIDYLHPDLAGNIWINTGEIPDNGVDDDLNGYIDDVYGYDFAYDDNDPMDVYGHGTHCSGIAAARGNDAVGVCGVSWGAKLMAAKFLDDEGSGWTSDAVDAITYAFAMGATITSNSWGGGGYEQSLYDVIAASGLFVAAAGNDGSDADQYPAYPAAYDLDNIISVAATDHNDELADFSNWGFTSVDLGAPGVDILSCLPGNNHEAWSGTSMATPHVSGCAVLLRTYNPLITTTELKSAILNGVDVIPALDGKTVTGGRLNIVKALESVAPPWISLAPMTPGTVEPGTERQFTVTANPQGLVAGTWVAEVVYKTNDPFKPDHILTVTAAIAPCRTLRSASEMLTFNTVWASRDTVADIVLVNDCNAPVTVKTLSFTDPVFTSDQSLPFIVRPFGKFNLPVKFSPKVAGTYDGTVSVCSDAEDNPTLAVNLHGMSVTPPIISVAPTAIDRTLAFETTQNVPVTLTNTGGADYLFKTKTVRPPKTDLQAKKLALSAATVFVAQNFGTIRRLDIETGEFVGNPITMEGSDYDGLAYDGEFLYYSNYTNHVMVINPETGTIVDTITCNTPNGTDGLGMTPDYIVLGNYNEGKVYICNKESGEVVYDWDAPGFIGGIACSESRQSVFLYDNYDMQIEERSISDGALLNTIKFESNSIFGLGYSEAAEVLIAAAPYDGLAIIDPVTGKILTTLPIQEVYAVAADESGGNLKWLQADIKEGVVPAGKSVTFSAVFNSAEMLAGPYAANLQVQHRRPIPPGPYDIKCTMTVLPEKRCAASPSSLSYTETWVGRTDTLAFYLVNTGNVATNVASITSNNALFKPFITVPVAIPAFDSVLVPTGFTPKKAAKTSGKLTVTSDAVKSPNVTVNLQGVGLNPPKISYTPKQLAKVMLPGKEQQATINLKNTGGADYRFKVTIESIDDGSGALSQAKLFGINWEGLYSLDPNTGALLSTLPGEYRYGPSAFDGTYLFVARDGTDTIDVIDPNNGTVVWSIIMMDNVYHSVDDIGVSDQYLFAASYNDNGYLISILQKDNGTAVYSWQVDRGFEGLCNGKEPGTVFAYNYNNYELETRKIETGEIITTISLKEYGWYLTYSRSLDALYMSDGYVHNLINPSTGEIINSFSTYDYMQIAADEATGASWLQPAFDSSAVPAKGSCNLTVKFNSSRMLPGTYKANLRIAHHKGWQPGPFVIPCELTVLPIKKLAVLPGSLDFGSVWIGKDSVQTLTLKNDGNAATKVFSIANLNRAFTFDPQAPLTVGPYSSVNITARFTPANTRNVRDVAIVISDAIDLPIRIARLAGSGVNPPAITVNPTQFTVQLPAGGSSQESLTLTNTGGAEYAFNISGSDKTPTPGGGDAVLYVGQEDRIVQLDPETFEAIGDPIFPDSSSYVEGLAFDGQYLYAPKSYTDEGVLIFKVDPLDPTHIDTIRTEIENGWITGLGVTGELLLAMDTDYDILYFIDKATGATVRSMSMYGYGALTAAAARQSLYIFNYDTWTIDELNLEDGSLKNQLPIPAELSDPTGAGYSNSANALFLCDYNGIIVKLDPDNGTVLSSLATERYEMYCMAADEASTLPPWLKVAMKSGSVPGGGNLAIGVAFDAAAMTPGSFIGEIKVTPVVSGAPGPFIIPCNLSVSEGEAARK